MNKAEIFKFLDILYRRRYICVMTMIVTLTMATVVCALIPKKYRVDSTVFIEKSIINDLIKGLAVTPDMEGRISVLKQAILSRDILSRVLTKLDYDISVPDSAEYQRMMSDLQEKVQIQVKDDNRFTVVMDHNDPVFAQKFINTLISTYVEENISSKRDEAFGASRFLDEQVELFKTKLDEAESAIIDYKRKQDLLFTPEKNDNSLAELRSSSKEAEMLKASIEALTTQKARLQRNLENLPAEEISRMEKTISQLLLSYTEDHPKILKLKVELAELKRLQNEAPDQIKLGMRNTSNDPLQQEEKQKLFNLETEINSLTARKNRLEEMVGERRVEMDSQSDKTKELNVLIQQRDSLLKIYEVLLTRMGQSEVSKQMELGDKTMTFRILDPAILPKTPVYPQMPKMFMLTLIIGFGAGIGVGLIWEKLDSALISTDQIETYGFKIVGSIPHIAEIETRKRSQKRDRLLFSALGGTLVLVTGYYAFEILRTMF